MLPANPADVHDYADTIFSTFFSQEVKRKRTGFLRLFRARCTVAPIRAPELNLLHEQKYFYLCCKNASGMKNPLPTADNTAAVPPNRQCWKQVEVNPAECDARSRSYQHLAEPLPEITAFEALMRGLIEDNSSRVTGCFHGTRRLQ